VTTTARTTITTTGDFTVLVGQRSGQSVSVLGEKEQKDI